MKNEKGQVLIEFVLCLIVLALFIFGLIVMVCGACASTNHEIVQLSGKGKVVTFTTSFIASEGRENEVPYTIVTVELDEGPWIMGNLVSMDSTDQLARNLDLIKIDRHMDKKMEQEILNILAELGYIKVDK